jgi:hypothetical protein
MKKTILSLLIALGWAGALAQIPAPQINLSGNVGTQGFPVLNSGTIILASDANHTMTAQETSAFSFKVTSSVSLTATRNLIFPAGKFPLGCVENATTGGQSIQVISTSGTGVPIASGTTVCGIWNDGTNFVTGPTGGGGGSGISGGTAGQAAIFGSPTTITSGIPINGIGAGLVTGPASAGSSDLAVFSSSAGAIADSSLLLGSVVTVNGTQTITNKTSYNGVPLTTSGPSTNFLNESGTYTVPAGGGGGGFPIILGSTSIAAGSTTTALTGLSVNGVSLSNGGATTTFLNGAGAYTTPAGGGGGVTPAGTNAVQASNSAGTALQVATTTQIAGPIQAVANSPILNYESGDSYINGVNGASPQQQTAGFSYQAATKIGGNWVNNSRGGDGSVDINNRNVYPNSVIQAGTLEISDTGFLNDVQTFGTNANWLLIAQRALQGKDFWFAQPAPNLLQAAARTGTCALDGVTYQAGMGVTCASTGSTITQAVTIGSNGILEGCYMVFNGGTATFTLSVGGAAQTDPISGSTTWITGGDGGQAISTPHLTTQFCAGFRIAGLTPGSQSVVFTQTATGTMDVQWIGAVPAASPSNPTNFEIDVTQMGAAITNFADSPVYQAIVVAEAATMDGDGQNMELIPARAAMGANPGVNFAPDQLHPSNPIGDNVMINLVVSQAATLGLVTNSPAVMGGLTGQVNVASGNNISTGWTINPTGVIGGNGGAPNSWYGLQTHLATNSQAVWEGEGTALNVAQGHIFASYNTATNPYSMCQFNPPANPNTYLVTSAQFTGTSSGCPWRTTALGNFDMGVNTSGLFCFRISYTSLATNVQGSCPTWTDDSAHIIRPFNTQSTTNFPSPLYTWEMGNATGSTGTFSGFSMQVVPAATTGANSGEFLRFLPVTPFGAATIDFSNTGFTNFLTNIFTATSIGAVTPGTGAFTTLNATSIGATTPGTGAFTNLTAVAVGAGTVAATTNLTGGGLVISGNSVLSGNVDVGSFNIGGIAPANSILVGSGTLYTPSTAINPTSIGAATPGTGIFTTLTATGALSSVSGALNGTIGATVPNTGAFSTVTDAGLTGGNCVQASTGGLLTTTGAACLVPLRTTASVTIPISAAGICTSQLVTLTGLTSTMVISGSPSSTGSVSISASFIFSFSSANTLQIQSCPILATTTSQTLTFNILAQ